MKEKYTEEFTFEKVWNVLKDKKKFLAIFVIAGVFLTIVYSYIMPYEYESTATILPPKDNSSAGGLSSFLQNASGGGIILGELGKSNQSQVFLEILQSRVNSEYIVEKLKLDTLERFNGLEKHFIVDIVRSWIGADMERSGLLIVTATVQTSYFAGSQEKDKAADLAATVANAALEGLDYVIRNKNTSTARLTRMYIEDELLKYRNVLDSIQIDLETFQSNNKVLALDEQTQAIVDQAIAIGSELAKAESELNLMKLTYNSGSEQIRQLEKQVSFLRNQARRVQTGGLSAEDEFAIPLSNVPRLAREYANLYRDQKVMEQVILYLETQRHQEAIQEKRDLPVVESLDEAVKPYVRSSPNRKLMFMLSFVLFSIVGVSLVLVNAYMKGEVKE